MTSGAINCDLSLGWVTIDGHSLNREAWCAPDLSPLWGTPEVRGADRILPGVSGVKPYRRRATVQTMSLRFVVTGQVDADGQPNDDPWTGLETNLAFLYAYVILPTNTGDGTRELVWHRPSGSSTTVAVHVLGYKPTVGAGAIAVGELELSIPSGALHL